MQIKFLYMFTKSKFYEAPQKHIVSGGFDGPAIEAQIWSSEALSNSHISSLAS